MRWLIFASALLVGFAAIRPAIEVDTTRDGAAAVETLGETAASDKTSPANSDAATAKASSADEEVQRGDGNSGKRQGRDLPPNWRENFQGPVDQTPPRIVQVLPDPGRWVVDNVGLRTVRIGFDEPVVNAEGSVTAWIEPVTPVTGITTSYDGATNTLLVTFAAAIQSQRVTVVVDFTITDAAGNELDGEIRNPANPTLPSGDGFRGGQAVFRFNILQGDVNRNGVVESADGLLLQPSLGLCTDDAGFERLADLNLDGCVNALDVAIFRQGEGRSLPATDGTQPIVTEITDPERPLLSDFDLVLIRYDSQIRPERYMLRSCFLVESNGNVRLPLFLSPSGFANSVNVVFDPEVPQCGTYTVNISNALADLSGELLVPPSTPPVLTGLVPPPAPTLNTYTTMTTASQVTITGNAPGANTVEVFAPEYADSVPVTNNSFTANVPLASNRVNPIFFTTLSTCDGVRSAPTVARVTHDIEQPNLFIDFPADGAEITTPTTDVAGRVGDLLSGFAGLNVQLIVNGDSANPIQAIVDVGIGNNGTFFAGGVPLGPTDQPTIIEAIATDALDNAVTKQITVTKVDIPVNAHQMTIVSGNNQPAVPIYTQLPAPIVVRMTKPDGVTPFAHKVVTFKVTRSDGRLAGAPGYTCMNVGELMLQCRTDANGEVAALWTMGGDAGCGNNRVEVTSQSVAGTVAFCASAIPGPVKQINIGTGNNQKAEAGGPAPEPLRVWVSDGCNGIAGVSVQFTVTRGGGKVRAPGTTQDLDIVTVPTGDTGHAAVNFTLGPEHGSNVIEAKLANCPKPTCLGDTARFVIYGLKRTEGQPTSFFGIVLNNAGQPIQGAKCLLVVGAMATSYVYTDIDGRFRFDNVVGSGDADLYVDGSTATHVGGTTCTAPTCDIDPGTYPGLHYEMVVVPNAANSLPMPVLLPPLDPDNVRTTYSATPGDPDTILTVQGMEGLEMRVKAGSMKLPGGVPAPDGQPIYLNQVHDNDIPMPIPDGASPPFAWTLQPAGATFDPPIEIRYPNMSGLPAGAIAYFLSFNHDTSRFEIIASGHVTDDGAYILTDPGAGLGLAGWGCNCPPYSVTGDCCSGCDADCCEGTCCNCACCEGECCGGVCCPGGKCCGGECCSDCCGGECCKDGEQCCNGECCADCCGGECCDTVCCEGVCCPEGTTVCCDGKCCPAGTKTCCDGECCMGPCCEATGECCAPTDKSCCDNECCAGPCCDNTGECCPADKESCCNDECCDGPCCGENSDICCEAGANCCGLGCCPPETPQCCDETGTLCCPEDQDCCDTKCCPPGWTCCNGECCPGPCCENTGECCPETFKSCCNDLCCEGPCCEATGQCCPATAESCCNNECCEGPCCDDRCCHQTGGQCCATAPDGCCGPTQLCCEATGGGCCDQGTTCCGETDCCEVGIVCCDGGCCDPGQMCCGQTTCCKPNKCCGQEECCADNQVCCNGSCQPTDCSLTLDPDEVCPGGSVDLTGVAICNPECVTMTLTAEIVEPAWQGLASAVISPGSVPCGPFKTPFTVTVNVSSDAMPGVFTVRVTGRILDGGEVACETIVDTLVTVRSVDLVFDGLPEEDEEDPGGLICVNNDDDDMSVRADKDDDPGPIIGEDDLKTLELKLNGLDPGGMGTLDVLQGAGGVVRVYFNPDRSSPVPLPFMFSGADLPITLFVEGYQASNAARDITAEMVYTLPDGSICKDKVNISVGGVEFEGTTEITRTVHRNMDLIHLINPSPLVQLDADPLPATGAPVVFPIDGEVTNRIAPLIAQDITINDQPVQTLILVDSGQMGLGPFKQRFSRNISLPDHDLLIKAQATDALGNSGWDKRVVIADFDCTPPLGCPGTFLSRTTREEVATPLESGSLERFAIAVIDPFATGDLVTVQIDTGVEQRTLQVPRVQGTIRFEQDYLYLIPENLNLPAGTPQAVVDTRLKGELGKRVRATYSVCNKVRCDDCEDNAVTVGIMFVAAINGQPVDLALAGLPKDVADGGINRQPLNMVAGLPGDASIVVPEGAGFKVTANLIARDYRDDPSAGSQSAVNLLRVSDDPTSPDFNLFQSDPASPLLPIASDTADITQNPFSLTLHDVDSGGFLRLEVQGKQFFGALQAVEPVRGPIVVNVLVDGLGAGFPQASFAPAVPPNFQTLLENGSLPNFAKLVGDTAHSIRRYDGLTTFPSITYSAWSSWATGKDPGVHGVTGSNFYRRDPTLDPFWGGNGEMSNPIDHVNFLGTQPIQDLDVWNVWATLGTLNSSIRPDVLTIYEALLPDGLSPLVVYHFPFRGTLNTIGLPTPDQGFFDHWNGAGAGLDDGTAAELIELMDSTGTHPRPPQVLTVYYASLDHNVHHDPNYPASGAGYLTTTDRYVGTLVRILEQWNLMEEAMFTFTGDHGLTDVYNDDKHSILIETTFYLELEAVFTEAGYDVLDNANESDYDSVVTLNGGMAHVYVRNRTTNAWTSAPNYVQDVLPLAERFYDNAVGLVSDLDLASPTQLNGAIELVLVRDATGGNWNAPYRVLYRPNVTSGLFTTASLGDALSITFPGTGLPLIPTGYVGLVSNIQRLQDIRSGDILLLSNYSRKHRNAIAPAEEGDPNGLDGGYYFGTELNSWHGSLYNTDMTIPIVFSFPRGSGGALDAFLARVGAALPAPPASPVITDIARTIHLLQTGENLP